MNFFNYDAKNDCNIWERFLKKKTIERDIYHRKFTYNLTTHTYVRQKSSLSEVSLTCQQKENVLIKINNEGRNNNARSRIFYFKSLSPIPTLKKKGKNLNRIKFQSYLKTFRADTPPRGITIPFDRQIPRISIPTAHRISPPPKDLTLKRFSSPPFGGGSDRTLF